MTRLRRNIRTLQAGWHILKRDISGTAERYKRYAGNAREICRAIVEDRWTGTFFDSSASLFNGQFWIRDFALSQEGLLFMGQGKRVRKSLDWAMMVFKRNNAIGTAIFGGDTVFDFWNFSADSLPLFLRALKIAGMTTLVKRQRGFLNEEIQKYFHRVFDPKTYLVGRELFSTPKDVIMRRGTCVANAFMIYLKIALERDFPFLDNPVTGKDLVGPFMDAFWVKSEGCFRNDIQDAQAFISADANVIPYWLEIISDQGMHKSCLNAIMRNGLDHPFPLKYHSFLNPAWVHIGARLLTPNYQGNSIWTMMAPIYIEQLLKFYPERAGKHLKKYLGLIEEYQTYIEVFEPSGKSPLKGRFGHDAETGYLWAAMIPRLCDRIGVRELGRIKGLVPQARVEGTHEAMVEIARLARAQQLMQ